MIKSFADRDTLEFWETGRNRRIPSNISTVAKRKLLMLDGARQLADLKIPPNNRLHSLHGDREGQHGIRINDQYRICFEWKDGHAYRVEILDYHD